MKPEKKVQMIQINPQELAQMIVKEIVKGGAMNEIIYTRKEAAKYLKVNPATLWNWANDEIIKSYKIGGRIYFKKSDLDSHFE